MFLSYCICHIMKQVFCIFIRVIKIHWIDEDVQGCIFNRQRANKGDNSMFGFNLELNFISGVRVIQICALFINVIVLLRPSQVHVKVSEL